MAVAVQRAAAEEAARDHRVRDRRRRHRHLDVLARRQRLNVAGPMRHRAALHAAVAQHRVAGRLHVGGRGLRLERRPGAFVGRHRERLLEKDHRAGLDHRQHQQHDHRQADRQLAGRHAAATRVVGTRRYRSHCALIGTLVRFQTRQPSSQSHVRAASPANALDAAATCTGVFARFARLVRRFASSASCRREAVRPSG